MDRKRYIQEKGDDKSRIKIFGPKNNLKSELNGTYKGKILDIWHTKGNDKLVHDWIKEAKNCRLLLHERAVGIEITTPYVLTEACVVELIFKICEDLKLPPDTRYLSLDLFQRYINMQVDEMVCRNIVGKKSQSHEWLDIMARICSQLIVRILSCVQLASKYCSQSTVITPKIAHRFCLKYNIVTSRQSIVASEIRVLQILEFNVGIPTLLVYVDVLLPSVKNLVEEEIYALCIAVVDIVYLQREHIFKTVQSKLQHLWIHNHRKHFTYTSYTFDGLFCGASVILASAKIFYPTKHQLIKELLQSLARHIEIPARDVQTMTSVILHVIEMP